MSIKRNGSALMPSGARITAGVCLAVLGCILSELVKPLMPEGTDFGYFVPLNATIGFLVGWIFMGKRAGFGLVPAINNGITGAGLLILWGVFVQGTYEMFRRAMRHRYDGPFESLQAMFELSLEYLFEIAVLPIILTFFIGGVVVGLLVENAQRRWP